MSDYEYGTWTVFHQLCFATTGTGQTSNGGNYHRSPCIRKFETPSRLSGGRAFNASIEYSASVALFVIAGGRRDAIDGWHYNNWQDMCTLQTNNKRLSIIITDYICTARNSAVQMHLVSPFSDCFFTCSCSSVEL